MYEKVTADKAKLLIGKEDAIIMGIESSCDETAVGIVKGRRVLANVINSQIEIHKLYGGVVPEIASRNHTSALIPCVRRALDDAKLTLDEVDGIAVTYGAGLVGALLVGVSGAKALSFARSKPLYAVNHIQGHICAIFAEYPELSPPFIAVVASGGHTLIVRVDDYNTFVTLGTTTDDAIGEAFDKVARMMGLPYPGGASVDKLAQKGKNNIEFFKHKKGVNQDFSLSYSGLKTAVINYLHNLEQRGEIPVKEDVCASFTAQAVDILVETALVAAEQSGLKRIILAGGVASNTYLRSRLTSRGSQMGIEVLCPSPILCTDNGVMIAMRGYFSAITGKNLASPSLNAEPRL